MNYDGQNESASPRPDDAAWMYVDKPGRIEIRWSTSGNEDGRRPLPSADGVAPALQTLREPSLHELLIRAKEMSVTAAVVTMFLFRAMVLSALWLVTLVAVERAGSWLVDSAPATERAPTERCLGWFLFVARGGGFSTLVIWTLKDIVEFAARVS